MTISIAALRKTDKAGKLYVRPKEITAKLEELVLLPRHQLADHCKFLDSGDTNYVPSECLVYMVREHRSRSTDDCSEVLYKTLLERFLKGISKSGSEFADSESLIEGNIRDEAISIFFEMLGIDRNVEYQTRLDFFEVRFNKCVAGLRNDVKRRLYRQANLQKPMEFEEDGEASVEFERAARGYSPFGPDELEDPDYGAKLDQAIEQLPPIQKEIIVMMRTGVKIESKETGAVTISGTLNKTPKTIAKHRDLAFATLKNTLKGETA